MNKTLTAIALATAVVASTASAHDVPDPCSTVPHGSLCHSDQERPFEPAAPPVVASAASAQAFDPNLGLALQTNGQGGCLAIRAQRLDAIEACAIKDQNIAEAIWWVISSDNIAWIENYCQPTVTGFKCMYKGITQIYRR